MSFKKISFNAFSNYDSTNTFEVDWNENEKWNPSTEQLNSFMENDAKLAFDNVCLLLDQSERPLSFRELRECILHSFVVLDMVLTLGVESGVFTKDNNRYSLTRMYTN